MAPLQDHHHQHHVGGSAKEVVILRDHGVDGAIKSPEGDELSRVDSPPMTERSNFMGTGPQETYDTAQLLLNNQGGDQAMAVVTTAGSNQSNPSTSMTVPVVSSSKIVVASTETGEYLTPREIQSPSMADQPIMVETGTPEQQQ